MVYREPDPPAGSARREEPSALRRFGEELLGMLVGELLFTLGILLPLTLLMAWLMYGFR